MANQAVRQALANAGMYHWELADLCGVNENTLCRWLRRELPDDTQNKMIQMITDHTASNPKELDVRRQKSGRPKKVFTRTYEDEVIRKLDADDLLSSLEKKYLEV